MQTSELLRFGFPSEIVAAWQREGMTTLLPIQSQAIQKHKILDGQSVIVSAPTSSGKTFVGELAAVFNGANGRRAIYLVPLKALAEEKFERFSRLYEPYGIRTVISTRDRKEFDEALANDEYDIAIIVYEKLLQLMNTSLSFMKDVGVIIFDELQLLADPARGATVELLLTKLKILRSTTPFQIIGLTAVLGNSRRINEWLGIDLQQYDRRPVELRSGFLWEGVFHYRTYNGLDMGEERLLTGKPSDDPSGVIADLVCELANRGEQSLVFVKDKDSARKLAEHIAGIIGLDAAETAITELQDTEPTESVDALSGVLEHSVAFYHADLTPEERKVVEKSFRGGEIKVLISTTTLAMGVNLPTRNVIIELEKWTTYLGDRRPRVARLPKSEFENMGGRAGRYQMEEEFGRAITIATRGIQRDQFRNLYWEGPIEDIEPNLWRDSMATTVLGIVALGGCSNMDDLRAFLRNTLTWHLHLVNGEEQAKLDKRLEEGIRECITTQMVIEQESGQLELSPLGKVVSEYGIRVETGELLKSWLDKRKEVGLDSAVPSPTEVFLAALATPDGQDAYINMSTAEFRQFQGYYEHTAAERIGNPYRKLLSRGLASLDEYQRAKSNRNALMLSDYIDAVWGRDLEKQYHVSLGAIRRVGEHMSWVVCGAAEIARALGCPDPWSKSMNMLALQVQFGVRPPGVWLAQLRIPRLGRERINLLVKEGVTDEATLLDAGEEFVVSCITKSVAKSLLEKVVKIQEERAARAELARQEAESLKSSASTTTTRVSNHGHHSVVVGVNHGTIVIGRDGEKAPDVTPTPATPAPPPQLSNLRPAEWRREVSDLIAKLSPDGMRELYEETRAAHHNRLRPLLRDLAQALTLTTFHDTLGEIESAYGSLLSSVESKLGANPLPTFSSEFDELCRLSTLADAAGKVEEFGGALLKRLARLVNLLEEFRQTPEEILTSALELAEGAKKSDVIVDTTGLQPPGDRSESFYRKEEVLEAFHNILTNAFESFNGSPNPTLRISSRPALNGTAIQISDNGKGISASDVETIFRDGYSTKGSSGYGLAHARRVFERHGGSLRLLQAEANRGATFEVVL